MNDKIKLKGGEITFGLWKNHENDESYIRACSDKTIMSIPDVEKRNEILQARTSEWIIAYSIQNGLGYLKGNNVEETFVNIQKMTIDESTKLGQAFVEFAKQTTEELKKK